MIRLRRPSPEPTAVIVLVALAVLTLIAPRSVQAGCSSRVHSGGSLRSAALAALDDVGDPDAPPPGRVPPCSGPSCSDGTGDLPAPPPAAPILGRELCLGFMDASPREPMAGRLFPFEGPPRRPTPELAGVQRPPRRPVA